MNGQILQGYLIEEFGKVLNIEWSDFTINRTVERNLDNENKNDSSTNKKLFKKLEKIFPYLMSFEDKWSIEFKKWFNQQGEMDIVTLHELANSELISEKNNIVREELRVLMDQWRNLEVDQYYCDNLFKKSSDSIEFNDLGNLDFYCFLLKKFGRNDLSKCLKREVITWLVSCMNKDIDQTCDEAFTFGYKKENLFHWYIERWKNRNSTQGQLLIDNFKKEGLL